MAKRALVILDLQMSKFKKGLKSASKGWSKWSKSVLSVKNLLMAGFAGYGANQLIQFGKESIELARVQADAEVRLSAAMKAKGVYTRKAFQDLKDYAGQLQSITTVGDETTISSMAMLQAFGLTSEEIKKASVIAADFGAAGKDVVRISELIGRAKMGETAALSRYGVVMEEVRKRGGDFNAVLEVMAELHQGEAEALRSTPLGKLQGMANAWGDIKDSIIGPGLANAFSEIANATISGATGMERWTSANKEFMSSRITEVMLDLGASLSNIVGLLLKMDSIASALATPFKLFAAPMMAMKDLISGDDVIQGQVDMYTGFVDTWEQGSEAYGVAGRLRGSARAAEVARITRPMEDAIKDSMDKLAKVMRDQAEKTKRQSDRAGIGGG